ncbi:MAG TPA: YIP1 family protein [Candidatus Eisenbacteria bacterium]|nr:YIP1 family protein [Candidatus Eisenbacteria bacterium]
MSVTTEPHAEVPAPAPEPPPLSPFQRAMAVYARPADAWQGLRSRSAWWVPVLVSVAVGIAGYLATYQRSQVPDIRDRLERQVESGELPAERLPRIEQQITSPIAESFGIVAIPIVTLIILSVIALLPWLAAGFMLGRPFTWRDGFHIAAWAQLVQVPGQILFYALCFINRTYKGQHIGFGVLLPQTDAPTRLGTGLGVFLDYGIGPFYLWWLAVLVLGTAALSGAPRKSVAWTLGGLYLAVMLVVSALAAMFTPAA